MIRRNKLLDACINGNGDIFTEIKKIRQNKPVVAVSMDNVKEGIPNHFKDIYSKLYNSVGDKWQSCTWKSKNWSSKQS